MFIIPWSQKCNILKVYITSTETFLRSCIIIWGLIGWKVEPMSWSIKLMLKGHRPTFFFYQPATSSSKSRQYRAERDYITLTSVMLHEDMIQQLDVIKLTSAMVFRSSFSWFLQMYFCFTDIQFNSLLFLLVSVWTLVY